jgi:hypothetical protein
MLSLLRLPAEGNPMTMMRVCFVAVVLCAALVCATAKQQEKCNSDTDCLNVFTGSKSKLTIDQLDLAVDTPATLLTKTPSWFGPKRPVQWIHKNVRMLDDEATFAAQGVALGDPVIMVVPGSWKEDL